MKPVLRAGAARVKPLVAPEVMAEGVPKRIEEVAGLLGPRPPKLKGSSLVKSDFSSTPLESFITHPMNVLLFSIEYLATGMDAFSIHLSSVES